MKVNGIRALDYRKDGDSISIIFANTTFKDVQGLDTALLTVTTDTGDTVESFVNYKLNAIRYDAATDTFEAMVDRTDRSNVTAVMQALQNENVALRQQVEEHGAAMMELAAMVDETATRTGDAEVALMELAASIEAGPVSGEVNTDETEDAPNPSDPE